MNTSPENTSPQALRECPSDRKVEQRAREIHAQACAGVDARTQARLAAARRAALDAHYPSHRHFWLPAGGAFAAAVLVLGVLLWRPGTPPGVPAHARQQVAVVDPELPLDADAEQMDLYQNLDFYKWLALQPDARAPHPEAKR